MKFKPGKPNPYYQFLIYTLVLQWLETFEESVTERQLQSSFPYFEVKPIYKDPNWSRNLEIIKNRILNSKKNTEKSSAFLSIFE